ncbi:MAG TPA: ATP-binding protein [Gammaproteobacteria bacterium]|nr:ATP-binding protein [Gammaproteobacteria bacterium]
MFLRPYYSHLITRYFESHAMVAILGPRQCGKTTLAREYFNTHKNLPRANYFDLEDDTDLARLASPKQSLQTLSGLIVIDEIQRRPDLFPLLRVLADDPQKNRKILILGSASGALLQQSAESLAGRIAYIELPPLSFSETHELENLWIRGGFPKSYLATSDESSNDWRRFYIKTFLEQDIPNLGIRIPAQTLRRFWAMLANTHGNILNASELGRSLGYSDTTIKRYIDILTNTFMIRTLKPWHENITKRQVKSPKIYIRDSGLLHTLLNIPDKNALLIEPKLGASWEGFALEEIIRHTHVDENDCYFWATHQHAELDLLLLHKNKRLGFEFKYSDAPRMTRSLHIAYETLNLDQLIVIYPGELDYQLENNIQVKGLGSFLENNKI